MEHSGPANKVARREKTNREGEREREREKERQREKEGSKEIYSNNFMKQ